MLNLDTHILIHALSDHLTKKEKELLSKDAWGISAIVIWEIAKLAQLKRITIDLDDPEFSIILSNIQVWPLTLDVCRSIKRLDFQGDPADEIIAATSLVLNIPLVTRDKQIKASKMITFAG